MAENKEIDKNNVQVVDLHKLSLSDVVGGKGFVSSGSSKTLLTQAKLAKSTALLHSTKSKLSFSKSALKTIF